MISFTISNTGVDEDDYNDTGLVVKHFEDGVQWHDIVESFISALATSGYYYLDKKRVFDWLENELAGEETYKQRTATPVEA